MSAIIPNGLKPRLCDSKPDSYNIGAEQVRERMGPNVSAIFLVHAAGQAAEADKIVSLAYARGVRVLDDCSQSHGAKIAGRPVGTFGDIAAFSTMYRKAHMTGPSGGGRLLPGPRTVPQGSRPFRSRQAALARGF
jgi:perosamine synthetase